MIARNNLRHRDDLAARLGASTTHSGGLALVRALGLLVACALALGTSACSKAPQKPPEAPLKQAIKDETVEEELFDAERHHLAPPPAYGNKVVMAEHADQARGHF